MKPTIIFPMAGSGLRFQQSGFSTLKPLLFLLDKPFFWWATQSALKAFGECNLVYVVLKEHSEQYAIDREILNYFPNANIIEINSKTLGAADTIFQALQIESITGPLIINDCDHAFYLNTQCDISTILPHPDSVALLTFRSQNPAYSYIVYDKNNNAIGTKEKIVVSRTAIAGCYMFASEYLYKKLYKEYEKNCNYNELFISGLYNVTDSKRPIPYVNLDYHLSFGTPSEYLIALESNLEHLMKKLSL